MTTRGTLRWYTVRVFRPGRAPFVHFASGQSQNALGPIAEHMDPEWPLTLAQTAALVKQRCSVIAYDLEADTAELCSGSPHGCMSILRYLFTRFSEGLSVYLKEHGHVFSETMDDASLITTILSAWSLVSALPALRASPDLLLSTTEWIADRLMFTLHTIMVCIQKASELAQSYEEVASRTLHEAAVRPDHAESMRTLEAAATARYQASGLAFEGTGPSGNFHDGMDQSQLSSRSGLSYEESSAQQVFDDSSSATMTGGSMLTTVQWMAQVYREQLQNTEGLSRVLPHSAAKPLLDANEQAMYRMQLAPKGLKIPADVATKPSSQALRSEYAKEMARLDLVGNNGGLEERDEDHLERLDTGFIED